MNNFGHISQKKTVFRYSDLRIFCFSLSKRDRKVKYLWLFSCQGLIPSVRSLLIYLIVYFSACGLSVMSYICSCGYTIFCVLFDWTRFLSLCSQVVCNTVLSCSASISPVHDEKTIKVTQEGRCSPICCQQIDAQRQGEGECLRYSRGPSRCLFLSRNKRQEKN